MIYRILKFVWLLPALLMVGCIKENKTTFTDFSKVSDNVIIVNSGLASFSQSTLQVDPTSPDTLKRDIVVDLAGVYGATADIPVTLFIDNSQITAYNSANGTNFQPFNANMYVLGSTKLTIPKGQHYAKTTLSIIQSNVDPAQSWMLPITIKDASGKSLTSNMNILYINIIGNPIAGSYHWDFTRYNNSDGSGAPNGLSFTGHVTNFVADDPTTVEVASGYYIGPHYVISFTNTGGTLTNFKVKFNDADVASMTTGGVSIVNGPNILLADPVNKKFKFQYVAFNGAAFRYIIDYYYP